MTKTTTQTTRVVPKPRPINWLPIALNEIARKSGKATIGEGAGAALDEAFSLRRRWLGMGLEKVLFGRVVQISKLSGIPASAFGLAVGAIPAASRPRLKRSAGEKLIASIQ